MNYTDFMAQLPENVQHLINQDDEPVNPKVMELVLALNKSGILTRMSGDLYGRDMVYVDFDRCFLTDFLDRHPGKLPGNWIITSGWVHDLLEDLDVGKSNYERILYWLNIDDFNMPIRLARKGGYVSRKEAHLITNGENN